MGLEPTATANSPSSEATEDLLTLVANLGIYKCRLTDVVRSTLREIADVTSAILDGVEEGSRLAVVKVQKLED